MTQTGYANAIVNAMLGWLKGLASWVLRLFNLSGGFSPLKFLADNWLKLLIVLLVVGVVMDLLVWLIRWRPHWVWFRKKRVIINDKNFFAGEKYVDADGEPVSRRRSAPAARPRRNWEDSDFVVRTAASRRRESQARQMRGKAGDERRVRHVKSMQLGRQEEAENRDVFQDDLFNVNAKQKFSDKYEDEVFNVSNLPRPEKGQRQEARGSGERHPVRNGERRASRSGEENAPRGGEKRPERRTAKETRKRR